MTEKLFPEPDFKLMAKEYGYWGTTMPLCFLAIIIPLDLITYGLSKVFSSGSGFIIVELLVFAFNAMSLGFLAFPLLARIIAPILILLIEIPRMMLWCAQFLIHALMIEAPTKSGFYPEPKNQ